MRTAIIPARGGSKGVPRKNIRIVAGKPLIAWNIEAALVAETVDEVVVSTDDPEIAAVSARYGATVVKRPAEISGDTATSESALLHAIRTLDGAGRHPDEVVFLQCTSPLTTAEDIDACVRAMSENGADTAFTAKEFFYFIWRKEPDGNAVGINHDKRFRPRRQDREPQYEENGAVYVMKTDGFIRAKHRFFGKTVMSIMPESRCLEIDTEFDLKLAEGLILSKKDSRKCPRPFPRRISAIILDFDGVMTDDTVWTSTSGEESVRCSRSDGLAIGRVREWGIPILILSSEANPVVAARAGKLGIEAVHGVGVLRKADVLRNLAAGRGYDLSEVVFMGNDLNDLECMNISGFSAAPQSAVPEVLAAADLVVPKNGGQGAVREFLQMIAHGIGKTF